MHPASRGLNQSMKNEINPHSGLLGASPSATILDTLKKKMQMYKDELEVTKDESDRCRHQLDEEKRRREVVSVCGTYRKQSRTILIQIYWNFG